MTRRTRAASRPLRALIIVLVSWALARAAFLYPFGKPLEFTEAVDLAVAQERSAEAQATPQAATIRRKRRAEERVAELLIMTSPRADIPTRLRASAPIVMTNAAALDPSTDPAPPASGEALLTSAFLPGVPLPATPRSKRISGSAWVLLRSNSALSLASAGQLGGSQAGARLFYSPGPAALPLTARISTPLSSPAGREVALGIAWRGRNVGAIVEHRIALDRGGRSDPAAFVFGGVSEIKLPMRFTLDGYAQAGVVGIGAPAAFADGALRIERNIIGNRTRASIGAGVWGGAQPGVTRLDIGPQVVARVPLTAASLRISAEWRERIAGNAAPRSGPSVTVGFDF